MFILLTLPVASSLMDVAFQPPLILVAVRLFINPVQELKQKNMRTEIINSEIFVFILHFLAKIN